MQHLLNEDGHELREEGSNLQLPGSEPGVLPVELSLITLHRWVTVGFEPTSSGL
jgi:hypothetical protein